MAVPAPPPILLPGLDQLAPWLEARRGQQMTVVIDERLTGTPVAAAVCRRADWASTAVEHQAVPARADLRTVEHLAAATGGTEVYLAVGGGSVLDLVRTAALARSDDSVFPLLRRSGRAGAVGHTPHPARRPAVVTVPTTLGTGAEINAVASIETPHGKKLLMAPGLRAAVAVHDPVATATLTREMVLEGTFEALARVLNFYAGTREPEPATDELAVAVARRLLSCGDAAAQAGRSVRPGEPPVSAATRTEVARLSALTQTDWLLAGREAHAFRAWYLANELASWARTRKVPALAALLPTVWRAVLDGDERLGHAPRLREVWHRVTGSAEDPASGVAALCDRWQLSRSVAVPADLLPAVARSVLRSWGVGLPMLAGLRTSDVAGLLARSVHLTTTPTASPSLALAGTARASGPMETHNVCEGR